MSVIPSRESVVPRADWLSAGFHRCLTCAAASYHLISRTNQTSPAYSLEDLTQSPVYVKQSVPPETLKPTIFFAWLCSCSSWRPSATETICCWLNLLVFCARSSVRFTTPFTQLCIISGL